MIQHILFPVDFSAPSLATGPVVARWARSFGARVTLVHAFGPMAFSTVENPLLVADLARLNEASRQRLAHCLEDELKGLPVDRVLVEGNTVDAICSHARDHQVDLIMMPTMGYTRFRQLMLGSVTAGVLHDSEIPVWTDAHIDASPIDANPSSIVCAVDCGPQTVAVVRYAQMLGRHFNARLKVVHSNPKVSKYFPSGIASSAHSFAVNSAQKDYQATVAQLLDAPALEILEGESISSDIISAIQQNQADLLVIGRGHGQGVLGRLRSNAHDLIRLAGCPVVSF
ncbi:MAG: universal stress protein [Acidobacteria bacterium]|nr:universal stress protein [Acidobacteriota bacterium]